MKKVPNGNRDRRSSWEPFEVRTDPRVVPVGESPQLAFERQFRRFEPMFHTVFYRKYHPYVREDAKQVGLLALYKRWCKDPSVFAQTPAFVVTAAIYGVSNWRKKEQKYRDRHTALVVDNHGKVAGLDEGNSPHRGTDAIDFRIDLERATDAVMLAFSDHPDYKAIYRILQDLLASTPFQESWHASGLARGTFAAYRRRVQQEFQRQLAGYGPSVQRGRQAPQTAAENETPA